MGLVSASESTCNDMQLRLVSYYTFTIINILRIY